MRYNLLNELSKYFSPSVWREMKVVEWETNMLRGLLDYFTNKNQVDIRERHCDLKTCCVTESSTSNVKLGGELPVA